MVLIPAGPYTRRWPADEGPVNTRLKPRRCGWTGPEVTNLQYKQFIDAANRKSPSHFPQPHFPGGQDRSSGDLRQLVRRARGLPVGGQTTADRRRMGESGPRRQGLATTPGVTISM